MFHCTVVVEIATLNARNFDTEVKVNLPLQLICSVSPYNLGMDNPGVELNMVLLQTCRTGHLQVIIFIYQSLLEG